MRCTLRRGVAAPGGEPPDAHEAEAHCSRRFLSGPRDFYLASVSGCGTSPISRVTKGVTAATSRLR